MVSEPRSQAWPAVEWDWEAWQTVTSSISIQAQQVIIKPGPATMTYQRVLGLMHHITQELKH